ncbi:MAG: hypothetical protein V1726_00295 [Methanobacteriota archaeon]
MAERQTSHYSTEDVIKSANKLLQYSQDEKISPALFLHSLIFTSEFMIKKFGFIPKDVAEIRRQSRQIIDHVDAIPEKPQKK